MKVPKQNKITLKQRRFVKNYLSTGKMTESALRSYDTKSKHSAAHIAWETMRNPHVKQYLEELLDEYGLSDERIAQKLKKIVDAGTRRTPLKDTTSQTALEAIKFTAKLKDIIPSQKIEQKTATLNLNLNEKSEEELQVTLNKLASEINSFKKKFITSKEKFLPK